jgi:hypothetical protein
MIGKGQTLADRAGTARRMLIGEGLTLTDQKGAS